MSRSKETFGKKEVRNKQVKKRKEKEKRRQEKKEQGKKGSFDDMIAWVDENGQICSTPPDLSKKSEIKAESIEIGIPKGGITENKKMFSGKITNFDETKGFGFINSTNLNQAVFVHANDCAEQLRVGDKVKFETEKGTKGIKAINVKKLS